MEDSEEVNVATAEIVETAETVTATVIAALDGPAAEAVAAGRAWEDVRNAVAWTLPVTAMTDVVRSKISISIKSVSLLYLA